jgi:hypothetical protein
MKYRKIFRLMFIDSKINATATYIMLTKFSPCICLFFVWCLFELVTAAHLVSYINKLMILSRVDLSF